MVARRRIRSTKDTSCHAGRLFRWQRRRRSTEDDPREENEDLTESPRTTPWLDGKEDEAAQKTPHARRTKISQETNLSMGMRSSLNKGKTGHYDRPGRRDSNQGRSSHVLDISGRQTWPRKHYLLPHRGPGSVQGEGIPPKGFTTVLENKMRKALTGHYSRPDQRHSNREHHEEHRRTSRAY